MCGWCGCVSCCRLCVLCWCDGCSVWLGCGLLVCVRVVVIGVNGLGGWERASLIVLCVLERFVCGVVACVLCACVGCVCLGLSVVRVRCECVL